MTRRAFLAATVAVLAGAQTARAQMLTLVGHGTRVAQSTRVGR